MGVKRVVMQLVIGVALLAGTVGSGSAAASAPALAEPVAVAPACRRQVAPQSGVCGIVIDFFHAVNTRRYVHACSLLGTALLLRTGGADCPSMLAADGARRYAIGPTRALERGTGIVVSVWFPELDHFRKLRWLAVVAPEGGRLRIIDTRRIA